MTSLDEVYDEIETIIKNHHGCGIVECLANDIQFLFKGYLESFIKVDSWGTQVVGIVPDNTPGPELDSWGYSVDSWGN